MNRNLYLPGYQFCPHCEYAGAFSGFQRAAHYMIMTLAVVMFVSLINSESEPEDLQQSQQSRLYSSNGSYEGTPWTNSRGRTLSVITAAETKFARCDVHTVSSEDNQSTINDWIFMEEMDAVNVIVMTSDKKFTVFKQQKYAIPGDTLTPVGGFIDKGEAPWESARREVMEELGLGSRVTLQALKDIRQSDSEAKYGDNKAAFSAITKHRRIEDGFGLPEGDISQDEVDWIFLGRYRTAANRGGGCIYTYLLKDAVPIVKGGGTPGFKGSGDDETQEIRFITMEQMKTHLMEGHFQEVKWTATIALALLHLQN